MDVSESERRRKSRVENPTPRSPLLPADKNNGSTHRPRTREARSRYRSPSPAPSGPRRCPSPSAIRTMASSTSKRALSAERKRPSTPPSPPSPSASTPVQDTSVEMQLSSRKTVGSRLPEALWPSTMRSLSVSFQSDAISVPVSKREKPFTQNPPDRTLRPSINKQGNTPPTSRKPTPERKRSPLKGKNSADHSENSRPVDGTNARLVDQHRWPSRAGGKILASSTLTRSIDLTDRSNRKPSLPNVGGSSTRRLSLDSMTKPLKKSASDLLTLVSSNESDVLRVCSFDDNVLPSQKHVSSRSLDVSTGPTSRARPVTGPGSRPPSPNRAPNSLSRGVSPSRAKSVTNPPSRGPSPSRIGPSSPSRQSQSPTSVLSFIADMKKGKKAANHIEDAHQLRLLYNRHLQWRFANSLAEAALVSEKLKAEKTVYSVWRSTSVLRESVLEKRNNLYQLKLKLKLYSMLNKQMVYLDEWDLIEGEHASSLFQAIQDLEASTLRLPVTGGAKGDIETIKAAVCSAIDVMQAMGSTICFILSQVEGANHLVSELASLAAQGRAMLDECEAMLTSIAAMQVEEYSLRTQLIQLRHAWRSGEPLTLTN